MIDNIGGVTSQLLGLALDASLARHAVAANNIANVNTPGYTAKRLNFEQQFAGYVSQERALSPNPMLSERIDWVGHLLKDSQSLITDQQNAVELDVEMIEITQNTLHYRALLEAASKRGEIVKMAVREGRR